MPKIIDHLRDKLLEEARRQILENGYENFTIRNVASGCGVGVGTVYNYFSSRDALIAGFLIADWEESVGRIHSMEIQGAAAETVVKAISNELIQFHERYSNLFEFASHKVSAPKKNYHAILRKQIAEMLFPFCEGADPFTSEFAAEALLTWTMERKTSDDLCRLILKVMKA